VEHVTDVQFSSALLSSSFNEIQACDIISVCGQFVAQYLRNSGQFHETSCRFLGFLFRAFEIPYHECDNMTTMRSSEAGKVKVKLSLCFN